MSRYTQQEYDELIARQATFKPPQPIIKLRPISDIGGKVKQPVNALNLQIKNEAQKKTVKIVLPFRLPTWNMLLAANPWQRKKIRDWIHAAILSCSADENDLSIQTELVLRPRLTESSIKAYCQMITPKSSAKLPTIKSKRKKMKR